MNTINNINKPTKTKDRVYLEIRAAVGGEDAALFAMDLCQMYQNLTRIKMWQCEITDIIPGKYQGYRKVILKIKGFEAFMFLQKEAGIHRIQRVPPTETQGRRQTSTVTVAVFYEKSPEVITATAKHIKIDTFRSSGHGGQNVNKVETGVRVTHIPTGITVTQRHGRKQGQNKKTALLTLQEKILSLQEQTEETAKQQLRQTMVQDGERGEKIRTYNYIRQQVIDHRSGKKANLQKVLEGHLELIR